MKTTLLSILLITLGIFLFAGPASASPITAETLQPANATTNFESIRVGVAGQGGVTFFNGSVLNEDGPYVIADDFRVEGAIWRGESKGMSDGQALKIADSMYPALTDANDLGSSEFQWNNAFFAGDVQVGNLLGSNVIHEDNISNNSITSAKIQDNAVNSVKIQNGTVQGEDLTQAYREGSAYDGRFVNISGDTMAGQFSIYGTTQAGGQILRVSNSSDSAYGIQSTAFGSNGIGIYGIANGSSGRGIFGLSVDDNGIGVSGSAPGTNGKGVNGIATGANGTAIYGYATGTALAGKFDGSVRLGAGSTNIKWHWSGTGTVSMTALANSCTSGALSLSGSPPEGLDENTDNLVISPIFVNNSFSVTGYINSANVYAKLCNPTAGNVSVVGSNFKVDIWGH